MTNFTPETLTHDKTVQETDFTKRTADNETLQPLNRSFKASLFEQIFNSKSEALSLYNAINGTDYTNETELSITTLSGALFMGYKNDISFLIDSVLNLYEHQSTWNPNMPLRGLIYFSRLYENYIREAGLDIYSSVRLKLPKAQYYVFYNGSAEQPDRQILNLSDSFPDDNLDNHLEIRTVMLNINFGHNRELMEQCRALHDYSLFIAKVREYIDVGYQKARAVTYAIRDCIRDNILREFLMRNQAGVMKMLFDEEDWERHQKLVREKELKAAIDEGRSEGLSRGRSEGLAQGRSEGLIKALFILLSGIGEIPDKIKEQIQSERNSEILENWLKLAVTATSIDDFIKHI